MVHVCFAISVQEWAKAANVTLLTSTEVESITRTVSYSDNGDANGDPQKPPLLVKAVRRTCDGSLEDIELQPRLLIGADGKSRTLLMYCQKCALAMSLSAIQSCVLL